MIPENVARKFWKHVENKLKNIDDSGAHYFGDTLNLPLPKKRGIHLNLYGTGSVLNTDPHMKNQRLYQPKFILEMVRRVYLKKKGKTDHYKESIKRK